MSRLERLLEVITEDDFIYLYYLTPEAEFNQALEELAEAYGVE